MATSIRLRGGTTSQHSTFTGAAKEVTVDTDKNTIVVHDGSTAGGFPLVAKDANGDVLWENGDKAIFGTGNDFSIYNDGSNTYLVDNGDGNIILDTINGTAIQLKAGADQMLTATKDGAVSLYYDNDLKFNTQSAGVNVFGILTGTEGINVNNSSGYASLELGGLSGAFIDMKAPFSDDYDGRLQYTSNQLLLITNADEPIQLRHNNTTRFETTSVGVDVTGEIIADSYNETYVSLSGTTPTVNCESGNVFALSTSGNTTFTFSNPPASGTAYGFVLKLTAGGTHTITYPASVDWAGGTAPDAPASGETDVLVFYTHDGGSTWYGALSIDAAA